MTTKEAATVERASATRPARGATAGPASAPPRVQVRPTLNEQIPTSG